MQSSVAHEPFEATTALECEGSCAGAKFITALSYWPLSESTLLSRCVPLDPAVSEAQAPPYTAPYTVMIGVCYTVLHPHVCVEVL